MFEGYLLNTVHLQTEGYYEQPTVPYVKSGEACGPALATS